MCGQKQFGLGGHIISIDNDNGSAVPGNVREPQKDHQGPNYDEIHIRVSSFKLELGHPPTLTQQKGRTPSLVLGKHL